MDEWQKAQLVFEIRMKIAALKQYLTDRSDYLTNDEKNGFLDRILKLTNVLNELQK